MVIDNKKIQEQQRYSIDFQINEELADALNDKNDTAAISIVRKLSVNDIVDFLTTASTEQREYFCRLCGFELNPEVLLNMDEGLLNLIIEMIGPYNTAKAISNIRYDDIVYIMRVLEEELREQITLLLPNSISRMLNFVWSYPEESAGRLIQKDVIAILNDWSVEIAIDFLNSHRSIVEELSQVFVVDGNGCPIGMVTLAKLFFADLKSGISEIMNRDIKIIRPDMDQEEVAHIFRKYGLVSAPVVGENCAMIGYVSSDDVVDVLNTEIERDILQLAGIHENKMHYSALDTAKSRLPWLFINIIMATITSFVIGFFDGTIGKIVILAALMPVIASTGGNAGIQSVTVVIRGLVKHEITKINLFRVVVKEVFAGFIAGSSLSIVAFIILFFLMDNKGISVIFALSIAIIFMFSSFLGAVVPLLLNFFHIDPAISSSIIVTTSTDIASYGIFLGMATLFLV